MKSVRNIIFLSLFLILILDSTFCKFLSSKSLSDEEEDVIATIQSDDEKALRDALLILWKFGGIIYIDTPVINIKTQTALVIQGSFSGGIVGVQQPSGEYPILNFKEQRDGATLLFIAGLKINASNKIIKNIIVENAGTVGISISGQKNTIDHVITRYNGQSGIYLSPQSDSNIFNYCYSYRNFHFLQNSLPADGFTVEIGGFNNEFNYCFAWDNSQNGFGYNYWDGKNKNGALTYFHSASWNNGNIDVFSGRYDFDNGKPLDKNLWTIQQIIKSDPNFEESYKYKIFDLDDATINSKPAVEYFSEYDENNNDANGFNFGHEKSEPNPSNLRTVHYCVAFQNKFKGFNSNKSQKFTGYFTNNVSFNNKMNYDLPYSFVSWNNNWSWGSQEKDNFDLEVETKQPADASSGRRKFISVRDQIIKAVYANTFPDKINFDKAIKSLN